MIGTREAAPVSTRSPVLLVVCAVAGLAAVAAAQLNVAGQVMFVGPVDYDAPVYGSVAVLVAALLAWHRWPRRSWTVLLVVGAVCAVPPSFFWLADDLRAPDWLLTPYLVVTAAALPLLQIGTLGAATACWRAGRRGAGAALLGATLVVPVSMTFSASRLVLSDGVVVPVIVLVVLAATVAVAVAAAVAGPAPVEPEPRPGWQVTIAGAVAGAAPTILLHVWRGPRFRPDGGDADAYTTAAGQHFLVVGLVLLGVGLLAGAAAGIRVLVTGAAAGLLLGALKPLVYPAALELSDLPAADPVSLAVGGLAVAVVIAVLRARLVIGVLGLGVLVIGLLVLFQNVSLEPFLSSEVTKVVTSVLVVVAVVAAVSTFASLGTVLAATGEAPPAFLGVAAAVTAGSSWLITSFTFTASADESELVGTYPPVIVLLVVVVALTLVAHRLWQDSPARPS